MGLNVVSLSARVTAQMFIHSFLSRLLLCFIRVLEAPDPISLREGAGTEILITIF